MDAIFGRGDEAERLGAEMRKRFARGAATGSVRTESRSLLDIISEKTEVGTGKQASLRDFYKRQEASAQKAADAVVAAENQKQKSYERTALSVAKVQAAIDRANARATGSAENRAEGLRLRIDRQLSDNPLLQRRLVSDVDKALNTYTQTVSMFGSRSVQAAKAQNELSLAFTKVNGEIAKNGGLLRTLNNGFA